MLVYGIINDARVFSAFNMPDSEAISNLSPSRYKAFTALWSH
jgi:hypothetical protein